MAIMVHTYTYIFNISHSHYVILLFGLPLLNPALSPFIIIVFRQFSLQLFRTTLQSVPGQVNLIQISYLDFVFELSNQADDIISLETWYGSLYQSKKYEMNTHNPMQILQMFVGSGLCRKLFLSILTFPDMRKVQNAPWSRFLGIENFSKLKA